MWRRDVVDPRQVSPIPAKAKGYRPQGVTAPNDVLPAGNAIATVAIDDMYPSRRRAGAPGEQGARERRGKRATDGGGEYPPYAGCELHCSLPMIGKAVQTVSASG